MSASVFPAYVGMSPVPLTGASHPIRVPRIRGDEPALAEMVRVVSQCSPHTWG